jgi:hypothetical protein
MPETVIPDALLGCLERHGANVARFASGLRSAGLTDAQIEAGVAVIIESFKVEFVNAVESLKVTEHV